MNTDDFTVGRSNNNRKLKIPMIWGMTGRKYRKTRNHPYYLSKKSNSKWKEKNTMNISPQLN